MTQAQDLEGAGAGGGGGSSTATSTQSRVPPVPGRQLSAAHGLPAESAGRNRTAHRQGGGRKRLGRGKIVFSERVRRHH